MPVRIKPLLVVVALALALAAPAAHAQQAPTLGAPETSVPTAAPQDTAGSSDGGLKTWQEVLIFGAGLVLLMGIGFAIVGDARDTAGRLTGRRGRRGDPEPVGDGPRHKRSQQSKQRARARARAAKAQRRKNR